MTGRVSVILPVRNAEETLRAALASVLGQEGADFDLWVVVNGSSDRSRDIAEAVAGEDRRVRVIESAPGDGVAGAMQAGVESSRGEIVARMDADDLAHRDRLARQVAMLDADPGLGVVSCGVELLDARGEGMARYVEWVNSLRTPEKVARARFIECPVIQPSLVMRRAVLAECGGYRVTEWAEDHDLFLRLLERGVRFGKVPERLLQWRDHPGRLTRSHPAYHEDQVWRMKAHYLVRLPAVRERGVAICGAGPIGKRLARLLQAGGVRVHGFFEVNPRRIGERIHDAEVAGPESFGRRWREAVLLGAVGVAGGRERVRDLAGAAGYREGDDFWSVC
ncbi:MAG: glycosyltransferase [Akkermansiaceae bacterium]|nr:glycosyltransferase [Akkermansiaceae bacterium]NNM28658.1 glycosyltransferase [Akkermansiaceae bacterium]